MSDEARGCATEEAAAALSTTPITTTENLIKSSPSSSTSTQTLIKMGGILSSETGVTDADEDRNGVDSTVSTEDDDCSSSSSSGGGTPKRLVALAEAEQVFLAAETLRENGNASFKKGDFTGAIENYTKAIETCEAVEVSTIPPTSDNAQQQPEADKTTTTTSAEESADVAAAVDIMKNVHLCYGNRAFCHIKMENYGLAILDSENVIKLNPGNAKGFYRRGCAYMCLLKHREALKDFQTVCRMTKDSDAEKRLKECNKQIRHEKFSAAIWTADTQKPSNVVQASDIVVPKEYKGPSFDDPNKIPPEFLKSLIDYIKVPDNKLHKRYAYLIVLQAIKVLSKLPTLVNVEIPKDEGFTICGDTHGQFYDLVNIFELNGLPSEKNPYLFNGDFVDRGSFSVEVIMTLLAAKVIYPQHVHLSRGNHETRNLNQIYGFMGEVKSKYDETLYDIFCECFCLLPLAHTINSKVFVVHGGLFSTDGVTLSDIQKIDRDREPPEDGIMVDMLWSDPKPTNGRIPSKRGVSCNFGPDVTKRFLKENKLDYVIRSHEMKMDGYDREHDNKMITIFSAPNYCDQMNNKGAFIRLKGNDLEPKFTTFSAVPHPVVRAMKFAHPWLNF